MLFLTPEQHDLHQRVKAMVREKIAPIARHIEATPEFPQEAYQALSGEKLFCLSMPKEYGGVEGDATSLALMVETIATASPSSALMVFVTNAVVRTIAITGTREQKTRMFAELKSGDVPMGFCLTEPDYGSDAASLQTKAEPTEGGLSAQRQQDLHHHRPPRPLLPDFRPHRPRPPGGGHQRLFAGTRCPGR